MASINFSLKLLALIALGTSLTCIAHGDEYDEAVKAYAAGEYKKAYEMFLPMAESGDADAQFHLGLMYDNGLGVKQDAEIAEKWYNRACPLPEPETSQSQ